MAHNVNDAPQLEITPAPPINSTVTPELILTLLGCARSDS